MTASQAQARPIASGTFDHDSINQQLALAAERCHHISRASTVRLPPGLCVACSVVHLTAADLYSVGFGKMATPAEPRC